MAIGMGAVMGSVNGVLVAYGRVPSIIVTLGTLAIYRTHPGRDLGRQQRAHQRAAAVAGRPAALQRRQHRRVRRPPDRSVLALVVVIVFQLVRQLPALGTPALCHRLQPGCRPHRRLPGAAHRLCRLCAVRRAGGAGRLHVPGPLRQHHRGGRAGHRTAVGGGGRGRRRQHHRRHRLAVWRLPRRHPDRPAGEQPDPLAGDQRILARCPAGPADPAGRRHRLR